MKKGFTLVELLAVVVILALILAIAVPAITSLVANAKKDMFANSSKMILKSMKNDYDGKMALTGSFTDTLILYDNGIRTVYPSSNNLDFTINATDGGIVRHSDGTVTFALYDGTNCSVKTRSSNDVTVTTTDKTNCLSNIIYKQASAPFTNLVANGDFGNGTTGWAPTNCNLTVTNNVLSITATAQYGQPKQTMNFIAGHVYYITALFKGDSNLIKLEAYDGTFFTQPGLSTFNVFSRISGQATSVNTRTGWIDLTDNRTSAWTTFYVRDVILVDLTSAFGATVPTHTQMDNNVNKVWIDTANSNAPKRFTGGGWVSY